MKEIYSGSQIKKPAAAEVSASKRFASHAACCRT